MPYVLLPTETGAAYFNMKGSGTTADPYTPVNSLEGSNTEPLVISGDVTVSSLPVGSNVTLDGGFATPILATAGNSAALANGGSVTITAAAVSNKGVLVDLFVSVNLNCTVSLKDSDNNLYLGMYMTANNGAEAIIPRAFIKALNANKSFKLEIGVASGTVGLFWRCHYYNEAV